MSFDTKYRPKNFEDVLGQEATKTILRSIIKNGTGFCQSYLFAGNWGSGKTTLGRILARALLCQDPQEGSPCDECFSCKAVLNSASENVIEFDAATNSGKDDIKKILGDLQYSTFSGNRNIYIIDESHALSKGSLDALLKAMEDEIPGSKEKKLVCIFCTTEPEKMRSTVLSRCAPAFVIERVPPEEIAKRLSWICDQEGVSFEERALVTIAELAECHIRDALKSVEAISTVGDVSWENTSSYLQLSLNEDYPDVLMAATLDVGKGIQIIERLSNFVSVGSIYEKLIDVSLLAFKMKVGAMQNPPSYWNREKLVQLGDLYEAQLMTIVSKLSSRPKKSTLSMLICDLATLLHQPQSVSPSPVGEGRDLEKIKEKFSLTGSVFQKHSDFTTTDGVYVQQVAVAPLKKDLEETPGPKNGIFSTKQFYLELERILKTRIQNGTEKEEGRERSDELGGG